MLSEVNEKLKPPNASLLTVLLIMAALYFGREVFVPLALAALLSFLLVPAATALEHLRIRRVAASLLVIFLSLAAVAVMSWVMLGQVYSLAVELPQYQDNISQKIDSLHLHSASRLGNTLAMLSSEIRQLRGGGPVTPQATIPILPEAPRPRTRGRAARETSQIASESQNSLTVKTDQPVTVRVEPPEESVSSLVNRTLTPLIHPVTTTFIVVVFLAFMLAGREDLRDRGIRLAGRGRMQVTTSTIEDASRRVGRYLRMQFIVNSAMGGVAGLCLWAIGVPNPLLWALLIAVLRFVPYIGILMASAGPLFLAFAVSPHWGAFIWTAVTLFLLELITGNIVEPLLYSSSTGISPIAVLLAAIFWTLIWGLPGLLLSTPLTVCLLVMGRQVPQLQFLEVILGDETALPPPERLCQRLLASNHHEVRLLLESLLNTQSSAEVFDSTVIPTLTLIEEARHAEELTPTRAEEVLQNLEEAVEDILSRRRVPARADASSRFIACVPAHDLADELACHLAAHVLIPTSIVRVFPAETSTADIFETLETIRPDVICVVGIPPNSLRHIRLRCHQVRARFPDATVFACVLSEQCDLPNIRARIPIEDAQHVVCSIQLMRDYLSSLLDPSTALDAVPPQSRESQDARNEVVASVLDLQRIDSDLDSFDATEENAFQHLAANLARSFDAPISLITVADGDRRPWETLCGLPEDAVFCSEDSRNAVVCARLVLRESLVVISDVAKDLRCATDSFFCERGIRFYAGAPLKSHDGSIIGALCVLDTRPRQITDKQREMLLWIAEAVSMAIELHGIPEPVIGPREDEIQEEPDSMRE